ncbi:MAG: L,D-transpeptidase family protein [Clostridia bacterium]|nr:L,D-transpeptidase family protein [Clostridia bacterium]
MDIKEEELTDVSQVVLVSALFQETTVTCYDCIDGVWTPSLNGLSAFIGENGVIAAAEKQEGDRCTPLGFYPLGFAFGFEEDVDVTWDYRVITPSIYWVDDPSSAYYNRWVDIDEQETDWNSAEHMIDHLGYRYGIVIEYNINPIISGKGSAIFLHSGVTNTLGCVALEESEMKNVLQWLRPDSHAHILIV